MSNDQKLIKSIFEYKNTNKDYLATIFTSPTDLGVIRNSGRSGARFAPQTILYNLGRLNIHGNKSSRNILIEQVSDKQDEATNFENSQINSSKKINQLLASKTENIIHIGGGHDHVLPLLMAIDKTDCDNILILNIDAHCDTRVSDIQNSGTPFRDFSNVCSKPTHLIQFGIHDSANSPSTISKLENISSKTWYFDDCVNKDSAELANKLFSDLPFNITSKTALVFSLDADAIDSSAMEGVSAVNGRGFNVQQIYDLLNLILMSTAKKYFGIYEYNPVYDNLSQKGSRLIAGLIYKIIFK